MSVMSVVARSQSARTRRRTAAVKSRPTLVGPNCEPVASLRAQPPHRREHGGANATPKACVGPLRPPCTRVPQQPNGGCEWRAPTPLDPHPLRCQPLKGGSHGRAVKEGVLHRLQAPSGGHGLTCGRRTAACHVAAAHRLGEAVGARRPVWHPGGSAGKTPMQEPPLKHIVWPVAVPPQLLPNCPPRWPGRS